MMAAWRILPRILHVDSDIIAAFDLNPRDAKLEPDRWNPDHPLRRRGYGGSWRNLDHQLWQKGPIMRIRCERRARQPLHLREKLFERGIGGGAYSQYPAEAMRLHREAQRGVVAVDFGLDRHAAPDIVVACSSRVRNFKLAARKLILIAIHYGPQRAPASREFAGEGAVLQCGRMRLPVRAHQQFRKLPLDARHAPQRLGVARRDLIPDAPDVLPAFVAHAVEEGVLQIIGLVAAPASADVDHVARLEPLELADAGDKRILPVAPRLIVPGQALFIGIVVFRLEHQRMPSGVG